MKKLSIVIEETGENNGAVFNVRLEGDDGKLLKFQKGEIKAEELSPAEFWGINLFMICGHYLNESCAIKK